MGRPGVRPRVLPQPPAAEVPVDAGGDDGVPGRFDALAARISPASTGSRATAIERRAAALLPGLLLARVDGKSPVEYLDDEADRERVRRVAGALLRRPVARLGDVADAWREADDAVSTDARRIGGNVAAARQRRRMPHPRRPRAPRLGQPRPADRRGRSHARRRRGRARHRAGRRVEGIARGARAARRRRRLRRPRRDARRRPRRRRDRARRRRPARPTTRPRSTRA